MSLETLLEAARYLEQEEQRLKNGIIVSRPAGVETSSKLYPNTTYSRNSNDSRIATQNIESSIPINNLVTTTNAVITTNTTPKIPIVKNPQINNHHHQTSPTAITTPVITNEPPLITATVVPQTQPPQVPITTKVRTSSLSEYQQQQHPQAELGTHFLNNDDSGGENKRRNGSCIIRAGTREVHNKLEKNRRAHLKECFEILKKQLPTPPDEKKSSNLSILHSALRYIQVLKRKERENEHEMERLAREKIAAQQKLSALKKELSAQWDHIDFNKLLPNQNDAPIPIVYSHSNGGNETSDNDDIGNGSTGVYSSPSSVSSITTTSQSTPHIVSIPNAAVSVMQSSNSETPVVLHTSSVTEASSTSTGKSVPVTASIVHPTLHLPLSQVMGAQGFVVSPPTIQLVAGTQGLRVLQSAGGERQLTLVQASNSDRPLALVQTAAPTHLDLSSSGVSTNTTIQETNTVSTTSAPVHKIVSGGVTLMSTPAGGSFRALTKGLTISSNGLSLCPTVSLASIKKPTTTGSKNNSAGVADIVTAHSPLSGLAPVAPLVVSQGSQLAHIITGTTQINGKVVTPLLKTMGQVPLMNTQYLSTATFVKPDVVVNSATATASTTSPSSVTVTSHPPTTS